MAKKMAQRARFEPRQEQFLDLVSKNPYLVKKFYLTGGTALAVFYLHHRESQDLDLFSESDIYVPKIRQFLDANKKKIGFSKIEHNPFLGLESFLLTYPKKEVLKVDFNFYPYPRIEKGIKWNNISIDSEIDIAANKLHTISTRARTRDFVDLFFLSLKYKFDIKKLRFLAKAKFDWDIDPVRLAQIFLKVNEYIDLPKMLVPFDRKKMDQFYISLAKSLEKEIFK
ncbi:nucleotidyl transferase AbiEii/AbiGii toxin family protein [Candidatus Gottesmanbacteria bacterium]|nr:nucleotidyl transferase AbiEii/AbiGii toxin family protein [Candidatus Gottesmanbacteria bacterium]